MHYIIFMKFYIIHSTCLQQSLGAMCKRLLKCMFKVVDSVEEDFSGVFLPLLKNFFKNRVTKEVGFPLNNISE